MCRLRKWCCLLIGFICLFTETSEQISGTVCGVRQVKTTFLMHHGTDASPGHWPWHVALFHGEVYKCGGSIIDENTILTASHCVYVANGVIQKTLVTVNVGQTNLKENSTHAKWYDVQKIIPHPQFDPVSIHHDIALIKLTSNITMNKFVQPVCLWTMDSNQELITNTTGTIVGFGLTENNVVSDQLKQGSMGVLDPLTCIQLDRDVFGTHLTSNMFCGKGQANVSACNGDSGGGMFFEVGGKWFVRGLVSFMSASGKINRCDSLKPTAFTDVAKYLEWIKPHIDQRVLSNKTGEIYIGTEEKLSLLNFTTCGLASYTYNEKRKLWTLPWIGSLYVTRENSPHEQIDNPSCVVTLISEWYAVGPAHCFEDEGDEAFIVLGSYTKSNPNDDHRKRKICSQSVKSEPCSHRSQTRRVKRVIPHPRSGKLSGGNDIALIELLTPADTTQPIVQPICLPVMSELRTNAATDLYVPSIDATYSYSNIAVFYMDSLKCMQKYVKKSKILNLGTNHVCTTPAIRKNAFMCFKSRTGTPLQELTLLNGRARYFLRGFLIRATACETHLPPVYIHTEPYLDWILYNMRYNTIEEPNVFKNLQLDSDWSTLLQEPGKENLRLFNMDLCGVTDVIHRSKDHVPWIGYLYEKPNGFLELSSNDLVLLVSQWYALAPKKLLSDGVCRRRVMFGKYNYEEKEQATHQEVEIKRFIIPPSDNPSQMFMLIELLEPADLTNPYIRPICLPFMERLLQSKPTEVGMVFVSRHIKNPMMEILHLTVIDIYKCLQLLKGYSVSLHNNSICAFETENMKEISSAYELGTSFQIPAWFQGQKRYFLYGMNTQDYNRYRELRYNIAGMPLFLFDTVELVDLQWMLENVEEKERKTSFLPTKRNERFNLGRLHISTSKMTLLNMHTCGESSSSYPTPWIGYTYINTRRIGSYLCLFTLINEWYAVAPAGCFQTFAEIIVVFGSNTNTSLEECTSAMNSEPCAQRIKIEDAFSLHYSINILLLKLATPANISRPNVRPICLPIVDEIRSYDTSSLGIVVNDTSTKNLNIVNVADRYVNVTECSKRWHGLRAKDTMGNTSHCVINQRSSDEECVSIPYGATLHSRQRLGASERHFLRGLALDLVEQCSFYYPIVYKNTDNFWYWILDMMVDPTSQ